MKKLPDEKGNDCNKDENHHQTAPAIAPMFGTSTVTVSLHRCRFAPESLIEEHIRFLAQSTQVAEIWVQTSSALHFSGQDGACSGTLNAAS